jgi:hypothetical protein
VLYGEHSSFCSTSCARPHALGLEIVAQDWSDPRDSRPLQNLLANSDVLLGLDDPDLYNSKTAKNLLLSSYGRQMALIGPNAGSSAPAPWPAPTATRTTGWQCSTTCSTSRRRAGRAASTPALRRQWQPAGGARPGPRTDRSERRRQGVGRRRTHPMSKRLSWDITPAPRSSASALPCC